MSIINSLERHAYAPELNKVWLERADKPLPAPGCTTIKQARLQLFAPCRPRIVAVIRTHYPDEFKWLERTYSGSVDSRARAMWFYRKKKENLAPMGSISIKTYLVG